MKLPKHIPQLDVLRGLAVLAVMTYHGADVAPHLPLRSIFHLGYTGVDLFFVLSGFLITGILASTKDNAGYFTNFYARRALRIWPLYYALLLFTFALLPTAVPALRATIFSASHPWQAFVFFVQNLAVGRQGFDTLRVTWSLAIEEQFYLVWPVIVWLAPRRMLKPLALCAVMLSLATRWSVIIGLIPAVNTYTNTLARLDGLGMGAFLALWIPEAESRHVKWTGIGILSCALPTTAAVAWLHPGHWSFYTLVSCCFAGLLCVAIDAPALAGFTFLKYTGRISYALYLVHVPLFDLANSAMARKYLMPRSHLASDAVAFTLAFVACYALAAASWHFYESRFLRLKSRFEFQTAPAAQIPYPAMGTEH